MKVIGFNAGQRGDLIMNTVACRAAKKQWPDCHLTLGIGKPFADMAPLFKRHPHIDAIHIWEGYDPLTEGDKKYLEKENFDHVFNPMPQHKSANWFNEVKCQTEEVCKMHDLEPPEDLSCHLEKWFEPVGIGRNVVCINPWTSHGPKDMSQERWEDIVKFIKKKGYEVAQLSGPNDKSITGAWRPSIGKTYFNSVNTLLSSKLLITLDGGLNWTSSAYKHPTLGLMGIHYQGQISSKSYQPINPNARYLEAAHANYIPLELIFQNIDEMLNLDQIK